VEDDDEVAMKGEEVLTKLMNRRDSCLFQFLSGWVWVQ
jgi:hypothetical protein